MSGAEAGWVQIGVIAGVHGLRGDLKVRPLTAGSTALATATCLALRRGDEELARAETLRVSPHRGVYLVRLRGWEAIDRVEGLVGCAVYMLRREFEALPEDEFYWDQLEGLEVVDRRLGPLGRLVEIFTTAAHDIYVVAGARGEILIPAVAALVSEIDPAAGIIRVDLPDGLVELTE